MKTRICLVIFCVAVTCSAATAAQTVVVTSKKVTYTRPKPIADFKKNFTVNHPKVKAASKSVSEKIEAALSYDKAFGITVADELREAQWLEEADFRVLLNRKGVLCVELSIQGTGAYPSGNTKRIVVDSRTGKRALPGEVFIYINGLVDMVTKLQKKEIADAIAEIKANKDWDEPNPERLFDTASFRMDNLKGYSIDEQGVTFYYDYGFPHVIQAMQPDGEYKFTWAQMKPFIRIGSLLERMTR